MRLLESGMELPQIEKMLITYAGAHGGRGKAAAPLLQ
jgi:hypothetical protein